MAVTLREYIFNCYSAREGSYSHFRRRGWQEMEMSVSNPFVKFMRVPLTGDTLEVPCIYKYPVMETLRENEAHPEKAVEEIYIPMMCLENDTAVSKSTNPLLRKFFYDICGDCNLARKKGGSTVYLGGGGLILYENYHPLLMFTLVLKKIKETGKYTPIKQILRIDPVIYSKDDLLAKNIRTKFMQGVLNMKLTEEEMNAGWYSTRRSRLTNAYGMLTTVNINYDFKVIIEDFSDFFYTPEAPDATFSSENINKMLLETPEFINSI